MKPGSQTTPFLKSFRYALAGIVECYRVGRNIRVQTAAAVLVVLLGLFFQVSAGEWCALFICIGLVLGGECMNTAVEDAVDLACPRIDPLAKAAKDLAAGAVLVFSLASVAVGLFVFVPHIVSFLGW
jgi:undecaprenol kinase